MAKMRSNAGDVYVSAEQLRVGLYVFVDLPWFQHPFMHGEFVIRSDDQILELRALRKAQFRYDPARSESSPDDSIAAPTEPVPPLPDTPPADDIDAPSDTAPSPSREDSVSTEQGARKKRLADHQQRFIQVEKSFLKSSALLRNLNRNLLNRSTETLEDMGELVDQMVLSFLEHPEATLHLMGERCGGDEVYSHVLNVSVLSMMLTRGLNFSPEQARILGLGALMHDIGLMDVPDPVLRKPPEEYTKPERELRAMHCEFGVRLGKRIGLKPEVLAIIQQHHEMADGSGYPLGLKLEQMTMPARVVAMVNFYDNLCNPFDLSQAMTPHEALSFMFAKRRNKFDAAILQQMIRCLGVYPPGSIVMLSNDMVALVMSINPAKPLRPWVMLHDATVPKENAILINLEDETDINISKAIRPALLSPQAYAYLSPRKRVTYFFDSNVQSGRGAE